MCVIYTVRAYTVCENDFSFEGRCWYKRYGQTGTRLRWRLALLSDWKTCLWVFPRERVEKYM